MLSQRLFFADGDGEAGGALAAVRASNDELRSEASRHKAELEELKRKVRLKACS